MKKERKKERKEERKRERKNERKKKKKKIKKERKKESLQFLALLLKNFVTQKTSPVIKISSPLTLPRQPSLDTKTSSTGFPSD
jgi:hypothetical protein